MVKVYRVLWDKAALGQLQETYKYIYKDSPQNAATVRESILAKAASLSGHPRKYGADKLRKDGDLDYRAFELHHYRVSYYIDEAEAVIMIIRVRHTSQEPLEY
jgi:plasmid stabilization system protein ParE